MVRYSISRCALFAGLALAIVGCGGSTDGDDRAPEFDALVQAGDYAEIEHRIEVYRGQGEDGPQYDYYLGVSYLRRNQDRGAQTSLSRAVAADSTLAVRVAQEYRRAAASDYENDWRDRGARRMKAAYELDGVVEMGEAGADVARLLFDERKYAAALPIYRELIASPGGTSKDRQRWYLRKGACLEMSGLPEAALEEYRAYWNLWPSNQPSSWGGYVKHRFYIVLLGLAEEALESGQPQRALDLMLEATAVGGTPEALGRARYLAGRACEDLGKPRDAMRWYELVVGKPHGEGGSVVEDAKRRIDELRATGTY